MRLASGPRGRRLAQRVRQLARRVRRLARRVRQFAQRVRQFARRVRWFAQRDRRLAQRVKRLAQRVRWFAQRVRRLAQRVKQPVGCAKLQFFLSKSLKYRENPRIGQSHTLRMGVSGRSNAEGVREFQPLATPWVKKDQTSARTLNEFASLEVVSSDSRSGILRTLSEFRLSDPCFHPGRCPGLELCERLRRWFYRSDPFDASGMSLASAPSLKISWSHRPQLVLKSGAIKLVHLADCSLSRLLR